ncbi:MAG: MBL fold metallo-hydrolase [Peptostreptococcaceae bacterium]
MYKYKNSSLTKNEVDKITNNILLKSPKLETLDKESLEKVEDFVENVLYAQLGKKNFMEQLSLIKYIKKDYPISYQYGFESFLSNKNSYGIIYAILSLLNLELYNQANSLFREYKDEIIEIINSNKCNIDEFINFLIYFKIPLIYVDDISSRLDTIVDKRKKYLYILSNVMNDRREELKNQKIDINEFSKDMINILSQLGLNKVIDLIHLEIENKPYKIENCDDLENYIVKSIVDTVHIYEEKKVPYKTVNKYNFKDDFFEIVSYKSKSIVNMHILKIGDEYLVIDCGAEITSTSIKKIDIDNFLLKNNIPKEKLKNIIITHAHLDHYGSVDLINDFIENIYITRDTFDMIRVIDKNIYIDKQKLNLKENTDKFKINDLEVEFIPSNHIRGSVCIFIRYKGKTIVHTGDFSLNDQLTTRNLSLRCFENYKNCDYLIMESTYGYRQVEVPYNYKKVILAYFVNLSVRNNIKVIIPSSAIGKSQECFDIVKSDLPETKIIIDGLATKVNKIYYRDSKEICLKRKSIYDKYYENEVIVASGRALSKGSCAFEYYDLALKDSSMVTFIKNGYIDKDTMYDKLKIYDGVKINVMDVSLTSHANYDDLISLVEFLNPTNLVLVHGDGIKGYI